MPGGNKVKSVKTSSFTRENAHIQRQIFEARGLAPRLPSETNVALDRFKENMWALKDSHEAHCNGTSVEYEIHEGLLRQQAQVGCDPPVQHASLEA
jgi:hypothetical protein